MPRQYILPSLLLLMMSTGCLYEIRDEIIDCEFKLKNCCEAHAAWKQCAPVYKSMEHCKHFRKGFIAGYVDVSFGANGCPPSLPPACYWKACHGNADGKAKVNAWFDGYSHGALAAEADGIAEANRIVTRGGRNTNGHSMEVLPPTETTEPAMTPHEIESPPPYPSTELPPLPEPAIGSEL
jgi:hypothetical protein